MPNWNAQSISKRLTCNLSFFSNFQDYCMSPQDSLKMLWHVTITPKVPIPPTCTRESSTWKPNWATCPQHPHPLCKPDQGWNQNNCPQLRKPGMCPLVMKWLPGILLLALQQVALQVCFLIFSVFLNFFRLRAAEGSFIFIIYACNNCRNVFICTICHSLRSLWDWKPSHLCLLSFKVHIFWEGHKILRNLYITFDSMYCSQK